MPPKRPAREKKNKLKLQFQVHPAGENDEPGALRTRSGRSYGKTSRSPATTGKGGSKGTSKDNISLPSSPLPSSTTEGMDSEEGQQLSRRLVKKLQDLGSGRGRASVDTCQTLAPYASIADDYDESLTPNKPPAARGGAVSDNEGERVRKPELVRGKQLFHVPEYKEQMEIRRSENINPPPLVEGPSDEGLRKGLLHPQPRYSINTLPEQLAKGQQPVIGGKKVGFVPYHKEDSVAGDGKGGLMPPPRTPGQDLYLPLGDGLALTQMVAWHVPDKSPEGNPMVEMLLDDWRDKYGSNIYNVDMVTGQIFVKKGIELREIPEKCSFKPLVGGVPMSTTPQAGLGMGTLMVETPSSKRDTPPPAESTHKSGMRQLGPDLGESYIQPKPGPMPRIGVITGTPDTPVYAPGNYSQEYTQDTPYPTPSDSTSQRKHEVSSPEPEDPSSDSREKLKLQKKLIEEEKEKRLRQLEIERQEREAQARKQKQIELLKERDRIIHEHIKVLETQIYLLLEGKRDLWRDLLSRRETQLKKEETPEEVADNREMIRRQYQAHITRLVEPIKQYWNKRPVQDMDPVDLLRLPGENPGEEDIDYQPDHDWNEIELLKLMFKMEWLYLEPEFWEPMRLVSDRYHPELAHQHAVAKSMAQSTWSEKCKAAEGWCALAKASIMQQTSELALQKEARERQRLTRHFKALPGRPPVVTPPDIGAKGRVKDKPAYKNVRAPTPNALDLKRKEKDRMGKAPIIHPPSPEEREREKRAALEQVKNITRKGLQSERQGKENPKEKSPPQEYSPGGSQTKPKVPSRTSEQVEDKQSKKDIKKEPGSTAQHAVSPQEYYPRRGNYKPLMGQGRPLPPKPNYKPEAWYCENCFNTHEGPTCPCPLCKRLGHIYYECPTKGYTESQGKVPDKDWTPEGGFCMTCGKKHTGECPSMSQYEEGEQASPPPRCPRCGNFHTRNNPCPPPQMGPRAGELGIYCKYCGHSAHTHDPNCEVVRAKSRYFQCSFCGMLGHVAEQCPERRNALRLEKERGYICTFCGSQDHTVRDCKLYAETINKEKQEIAKRNAMRYEQARLALATVGEPKDGGGPEPEAERRQPREGPKQPVKQSTKSRAIDNTGEAGIGTGAGGGGEPPRRPPKNPKMPADKLTDEEDEEKEETDDERTETLSSVSSEMQDIILTGPGGIEIPLEEFLRMKIRKGRKNKKNKNLKQTGESGGGGGNSPPSSDSEGPDNDFDIRDLRGKRGHRGQRGRTGPQGQVGPPGPPIQIPPITLPRLDNRTIDGNITMDTSGMERSFQSLGDSITKMFGAQQTLNQTMQHQIARSSIAQGKQTDALKELAQTYQQRDYDRLYNSIPIYNGEDPAMCEVWIEKLETACRTGGRDIRDVAITCAEGPVLEVINSVEEDADWPEIKEEIRRCFSENKTRVHAAAMLEDFPVQGPNENLRSFVYKYVKIHKIATDLQAKNDYDLRQKLHFLKRLRNTRIANKIGRSNEFKNYDTFSLAMCLGRALEMEGEFQVGEKCITPGDPTVMNIDVGEMSDAQIYQVTGQDDKGRAQNIPKRFNPNPCWKCGRPGHKALECPERDVAKPDYVGTMNHSVNVTQPIDRDAWTAFFTKCVKANAAKKFRKFQKKFEKALTTAQATRGTTTGAVNTTTSPSTTATTMKKHVHFAPNPAKTATGSTSKNKMDPNKPMNMGQPMPRRSPRNKATVNEIDIENMIPPTLTEDEEEVLQALEESGALDSEEGETEGDSVSSEEEKE